MLTRPITASLVCCWKRPGTRAVYPHLAAIAFTLFAAVVAAQSDAALIGRAEGLLTNLQSGKFAEVVKEFDQKMAAAIPEDTLRGVWEGLSAKFGAVKTIDERRSGELQGYRTVELILSFEKERVVQRVLFGGDGKIAGLAYNPATMAILPATK